jgi:hypothetical protein
MEGNDLAELLHLVNDRISLLGIESRGATTAFWCECGWPGCKDQVHLRQNQYELTGAPLLAPGHTVRQRKPLPLTVMGGDVRLGNSARS